MNAEPMAVRLDTGLENIAERLAILPASCVLATVVATQGSTYRKPGARMLIERDGHITGLLSGGCLEQDLKEHTIRILSAGVTKTVTYDMRSDDDLIFGIGAGCEGCMEILLEPAHVGGTAASSLLLATEMSQRGEVLALPTVFDAPDARRGTRLWHPGLPASVGDDALQRACADAVERRQSQVFSWYEAMHSCKAWIQVVLPPPSVLICGAGPDAQPLVSGLRALRYPVTVVDHRPAYANPETFPGATVVSGDAESLAKRVDLGKFFAAVVMSHHLESDADYLRVLARSRIGYVGLLGPSPRRARLLKDIGDEARAIESRLRSPVGLDIGAVTPEGIALAIVAELHAAAAGRHGGTFSSR